VRAEREPSFLLVVPERRLLRWIAAKLPRWVTPDRLTALGVLAALACCGAYALADAEPVWLWIASGLLVVQWLGDSLDGTLARVRQIERPRYGYYLDHLVDALGTAAVGIGLGLSGLMSLPVACLLVIAYLVLSINVYLESQALGRFSIGYGLIGPTEARLILIALNTAVALGLALGDPDMAGLSAFDIGGLGLLAAMVMALLVRARGNLTELARAEPALRR
jgi:phosphatidylglycerophosphate synthase